MSFGHPRVTLRVAEDSAHRVASAFVIFEVVTVR